MSTRSCLQSLILIQPRTGLWKVKTAPQEGPNGDIRNGDGNMNVYWEWEWYAGTANGNLEVCAHKYAFT